MNERGFTMVELLVAIFLIALGLLAIASTFDTSRNLVSASERKEASVHIAEQEIERIRAMDYGDVGLTSLPSTSSNQYHPNYWVTGTSYRYDHKAGGNTEPMVVSAGGFDPDALPRGATASSAARSTATSPGSTTQPAPTPSARAHRTTSASRWR